VLGKRGVGQAELGRYSDAFLSAIAGQVRE